MENEKSVLYTVVLGLCMLASLLLVGKMLLHRPAPVHTPSAPREESIQYAEHESDDVLYLSQEDIEAMINSALPEAFPASAIGLSISKDGTVSAQGTLQKEKLSPYIEKESKIRSALLLMPAEFALRAEFDADHSTGKLVMRPQNIAVGGFHIASTALESSLTDMLNAAVDVVLDEQLPGYTQVLLHDGGIELLK